MLAADFGTGQVFWSMLWFFMFFIWIWLLFVVFGDMFARGHKMQDHAMRQTAAQEAAFRDYVQNVAATDSGGPAGEITKLADLRDRGVITEDEFQRAKARAIG
jgi:hypothetical protein